MIWFVIQDSYMLVDALHAEWVNISKVLSTVFYGATVMKSYLEGPGLKSKLKHFAMAVLGAFLRLQYEKRIWFPSHE